MPNDTFRMLICGNSGSRKTNLLYHMLIVPLLYYDAGEVSKFDK